MGFPIDESLEVGKNNEEPVLKKGIHRGKKISYVTKFDTNYLRKILTSSDVDKQTKEAIKQCVKQSHQKRHTYKEGKKIIQDRCGWDGIAR